MNDVQSMGRPIEKKQEGYSAKEQELIRQLTQARLEKKSELEYESFEGYEMPPRTQFSMLKKPAVSIKYGKLLFNTASVRLFEGIKYIVPLVHPGKRRFTIVTCVEEESASVEWARKKQDVWVNKEISSLEFVENIYKLMNWDRNCRYKILGRVANSEKGLVLIFDLPEAIMFTTPVEFVDKKTGEVKKRNIIYYPDEYKDRIGKSYNDYVASHQVNMFETFDGYTGRTYGDRPEIAIPQPMVNSASVNPYNPNGGIV